tara:strand:+ start:979 stop:1509 length:531 start_codon:yes stop_codon:yes gene_type:complete
MWEFEKLISDIVNSTTVQTVFGNPIYSAIIIVSMVLLIIYLTTRNEVEVVEDSEYSMMGLIFTSGIYCIITVLTLVYLQHRSITKDFERRYSKRSLNDTVTATLGGTVAPPVDIYDPVPALLEGSEEEDYYAEESEEIQPKKKKKKKKRPKPKKEPEPEEESEEVAEDEDEESDEE